MEKGTVIQFGKHKGKPIEEVMATDPPYVEWLTGQPWFRERFATIYQTIINVGSEPEETPEHNAMQARFLNREYRLRVAMTAGVKEDPNNPNNDDYWCEFEVRGWDVLFIEHWKRLHIECKPTIGDDYPAVLRQIKARMGHTFNEIAICLVGIFNARGADLSQVREIFRLSGIILLLDSDVDG